MLKQSRFLTAFQQDRNPLIQLNQDNIENTEKRRTMPPTLPTENAAIQQKTFQTVNKQIFSFLIERRYLNASPRGIRGKTGDLCNDPHVSHHTNRESHAFDFCYMI